MTCKNKFFSLTQFLLIFKAYRIVDINSLGNLMATKISQDPKMTVALKSDDNSRMQLITEVHTQLRKAQALKLNYSTLTKPTN